MTIQPRSVGPPLDFWRRLSALTPWRSCMMPTTSRRRLTNSIRARGLPTEGASSHDPVGLVKELEGVVHEGVDLARGSLSTAVEVLVSELGEQDRQAKLVVVVREVGLELIEGGVVPVDALVINLKARIRIQ